ncbi:LacI family DNA-binding transcriptional regulator [Actinorugispora endophytica]|uniref:LacI family transcriptional regulator n=1 Tax=Actinorugispora endophytica TaxID=1605990 RepID=A0A4V3D737_9ACTN|nr:LacI family DNA-binding transcriptional regulator [Actinorugispora endophytica]TDQ46367.1 LacI family transcriptional regulator [Actinorugispora endophytica]
MVSGRGGGGGGPGGRTAQARPRQSDIARAAGVSQTTVSLVLGGNKAGVVLAEDTKRRVLEAAESLGYAPDPVATRLASARNDMLGLFTFSATFPTEVAHSYYPVLVGVEEEAAALGQDLILFTGSSGAASRAADPAAVRRVRVADGCLFFGRHVPTEQIERLARDGYPFVYIGRRDELGERVPYVGADYVPASAEVVRRLADLGHRRVRYVRENDDAPASADRERGVLAGARECGIDTDGLVVRTDGSDITAERVRAWRAEGVTALVTEETDTAAALSALTGAVEAAGLDCPRDVSLAVLGDPPASGSAFAHISGFTVPRREMGRRAVRLLVELVTGDPGLPAPPLQQLVPCEPVPGRTIGPAPSPAP